MPLMKPAILVALLFRTLDAFRIFDNGVHHLTRGAHNTEIGLDPRLQPADQPAQPGAGLGRLGADLHCVVLIASSS